MRRVEPIQDYAIVSRPVPYRVIYGDTDSMGVVYNANYLRIFEMARTEAMRDVGIPYKEMEEAGTALPVVEAYVRYRNPARYDDLLEVIVKIALAGPASIRFEYEVRNSEGRVPVAEGHTVHAAVDMARGRPGRLPEAVRTLLDGARAKEELRHETGAR